MNETVYKVMPCSKNIIFCKMEFTELERGNIILCKMGFIESEHGHPELVQIKKPAKLHIIIYTGYLKNGGNCPGVELFGGNCPRILLSSTQAYLCRDR